MRSATLSKKPLVSDILPLRLWDRALVVQREVPIREHNSFVPV